MFQITVLVSLKVNILCLKSGIVSGMIRLCRGMCSDTVHFHTGLLVFYCSQLHVRSGGGGRVEAPPPRVHDIYIYIYIYIWAVKIMG